MNKLLIVSDDAEEYARHLRSRSLPDLEMFVADGIEQAATYTKEANIMLGKPAWVAPLLERAEGLLWVQSAFAGIEPLCSAGLRTDYTLTGVKGVFGPLMSEYVFSYVLALERNLLETRQNQRRKKWEGIPYRGLSGLTIGICGLGSIGRHIAATAAHFQMRVLGLTRSPAQIASVERVYGPSDIRSFAESLDYLVVVLPDTEGTKGTINEEVIQALKPSAVLINVGRGAAVDEQALERALRSNGIRAAVLDVFCEEPLPQDNPMWELENAYVTPHNAAFTFPEDIVDIFCDNYRRFTAGESLKFVIDFERGY